MALPRRLLLSLGAAVSLTACSLGSGAPTSAPATTPPGNAGVFVPSSSTPGPTPSGAAGRDDPLYCTAPGAKGAFPAPAAATEVTVAQIGSAVGFNVVGAQPIGQSSFSGYEACTYSFDTPSGIASEQVALVVGTNPNDGVSATEEFVRTESEGVDLADRSSGAGCTAATCGSKFTTLPGVGEAAIKTQTPNGEVIAARNGRVYVEIGTGDLKESRMINLAQLILAQIQ